MNDIERAILQLGVQMGHDDRVITDESCDIAISALENNEQLKRDLAAQNEYSERLAERLRATNNLLKKVRKKQLNSGWIPVSERLPNEEECNKHKTDELSANYRKFLCTIKIQDYESQTRELYFSEIWGWKYGAEDYNKYVIAWQPLPEPYKEVEDED